MSIFSTILEKLGIGKKTPKSADPTPKPATTTPKPAATSAYTYPPTATAATTPKPVAGTSTAPAPATVAPKPAAFTPPVIPIPAATAPSSKPGATPVAKPEPEPEPISVVDVYAKLEGLAAKLGTPSNWKTSIADLLQLLGMDNSYKARKELAIELGCPANLMDDSAKMNTWLHKTVLTQIAENGGNIPKELLD